MRSVPNHPIETDAVERILAATGSKFVSIKIDKIELALTLTNVRGWYRVRIALSDRQMASQQSKRLERYRRHFYSKHWLSSKKRVCTGSFLARPKFIERPDWPPIHEYDLAA